MKRFMLMLLALLTLLFMTCCGGNSKSSGNTEVEKDKLIKVGFSQTGAESVWRVVNTESIKKAISTENGYQLIYNDGQQKQENQIRAIRSFIQQGVDYIVLAPLVEAGWDSVLDEAKKAGIPVIIIDRMVNVEDNSLYTAYVGTNFLEEGETAVSWLKTTLEKYDRNNDTVNIVDIQGTMNSTAQIGRTAALEAAIENTPNWKLVAQECGEFTKPKAYEVMNDILSKTRDIDVVYCENDSEAFGAIEALQEAGFKCGVDGDVIVISFDATSEGLEDCLSGLISLNVECNPLQGPYVENIIRQLSECKDVNKIQYLDETYFDCFNITRDIIDKRAY
ncbi:MAG: ABC transporter substrate-binding protein [Oscillospiraceae bacterium]